ncbi:MAG TPA: proline iminopeptidase-family hydrolase [Geminicoccus sp.]|jgi:proline iminopeptidase|uniref:proline iminopeptidase-family hydrolase n=1 Tax=Geminicoccus sp. TaxID=2024832 RepID=UPI002E34757A|nr:proline iminopeptidase-family hydrolase [Geminicoccus sp.]HEX2527375.1 proline iminopeptidase-family hydrolase [Geminicoccus sp.]
MTERSVLADGFVVWEERPADATFEVALGGGHKVKAYAYGDGSEVVFLLNGGPGLPCNYLRAPHLPIVEAGYRVVVHDQLGTGASDHPDDPSLWTLERYVEEVEAVLDALDLERVHFLGHSWGGWCGIEYALTYPHRIASMVLADTAADIPHLLQEIERLRAALGSETVAMMQRFEAMGNHAHPAYKAAVDLLDFRHIRRLPERPKPVADSRAGFNLPIYMAVQGPNEYHYTGSIRDWNRIDQLHRFTWPTLVIQGQHDVLTPACGMHMLNALPNGEIRIFQNSSHSPFYEEPRAYRRALLDFLDRQRV